MTSPTAASSSFMLLFRNGGHETHGHLTNEEKAALAQRWNAWYDGLASAGKVQHGQPLGLEGRVVIGARGERVIDGPFAEAKEVVAGYLFLTVESIEEATRIARGCPGLPLGMTVEVRPVAKVSPVLDNVVARPPKG